MLRQKRLSKKMVYGAMLVSAIYILFTCLESLMVTKDSALFEAWRSQFSTQVTISDYAAVNVMNLLQSTLIPAGYALHLYFAHKKAGLLKIAYWVWGLLLFYILIMQFLRLQISNPIFWIRSVLAVLLFLIHCNISYGADLPEANRKEFL